VTDPQDNADATTHRPDAHPPLDPAALRPDPLAVRGELDRFVCSRYGNPTVGMFEERLRLLEGAAQRRWRPTHQTTPAASSGDSTRNGQSS